MMDPDRKATLDLIETVSAGHPVPVRGRQLLLIARDYVEDGDLLSARELLGRMDEAYFTDYLYQQAVDDKFVSQAVACLIDAFGLGFAVLSRPGGEA